MDDMVAVSSDGSWGHNLTGLHAGKASCRFSSDFSTFSSEALSPSSPPPCKQAWRRPTCPSPVTTYVCTTWRIRSRFFMCLHERCTTWMDILQVTKRYSYSPQTKDKCVGLWRTWSLGSTTLRTSAVLPSADIEPFLGSRWCGAKWDLGILCHFFPMAHPMALKRPVWGWSSSFHQRCRRIFCSSCWRRQTPALQSLSWQLCIPRTAKRIWCQGGRYWWCGDGAWVLCVHFQVEGPKYLKFHGLLEITFDASRFSEQLGYSFPKTVVPGSIGYTAPKQRDTTNARCVAKCGRRSWSSGTCAQCKSSRLTPMGTNIIGETAGWGVKIFRVWWFSDLAMILC